MILDATQWRAWHGADFPEGSWYRDEEQLCAIVGAPRIDLISRERYANFILRFEYALPVGGNSGVFYRVDEAAELAWHSGPEMQLLDDAVHPDGAEPTTRNGALYGLRATQQETPIEPGSFMEGALMVRDADVEHCWTTAWCFLIAWMTRICACRFGPASSPTSRCMHRPPPATSCCSTMARPCAFAACRSNRSAERRPWIGAAN